MFFIKGWMPLAEVTRQVFARYHKNERPQIQHPGLNATEAELDGYRDACEKWDDDTLGDAAGDVWTLLATAGAVGVLCPNGNVVHASVYLVEPADYSITGGRMFHVGEHIDLHIGTVGSAGWVHDDGRFAKAEDKLIHYGPFLYCPIVLPERDVHDFLDNLDGLHEGEEDEDIRSLPARIVEEFDADASIRKTDIRQKLCPTLKHSAFEAAYQEAALSRPALNKRGPKARIDRSD